MTNALAVREKEDSATGCTNLANLSLTCTQMDAEVLGEYVEQNWDNAVGTVSGLMYLVKEMKRRFKLLDRKKQVNGTYKTIRGFTSFDKWFTSFTGKSRRLAYYLLESEEQKHKRNAERRTTEKKKEKDTPSATPDIYTTRYADAKKKLTDLWRERDDPFKDVKEGEAVDFNALEKRIDPNPTISAVIEEVLAAIAPDGCVIGQADNDNWYVTSKDKFRFVTPEEQKAQRSASAKKAAVTRAKNNVAAKAMAAKIAAAKKVVHSLHEDTGTLKCHPRTKPTPTQLTSADETQVTCKECLSEIKCCKELDEEQVRQEALVED
jgi:hypothetical protein